VKITIEPESDTEKALPVLKEPWVRTGCIRFGLSGITDKPQDSPTPEFGFVHGDGIGIRGDLARIVALLEGQAVHHATVNGLLNAQQIIANAQRDQALANEIRNGKPFKLHRP
jgi:hypothetical protein